VSTIKTKLGISTLSGSNTGDQTITLTGDVTGSGTGSFASTIANGAVTYAKIQNVTAGKLLGSTNASAASPGEITVGSGLSLSGNTLTASGSGGTVTNVNPITVSASGNTFTSTVTNATSTPSIALIIPLASVTGTTAGLLSKTDYDVFNAKQSTLTLGTGVQTFLATPTSANLIAAVSDETGSGSLVFGTSPTLVSPLLGNATATSLSSGTLSLTTALSSSNGGTGQNSYTTGDILYASAANTLSKLSKGSDGTVLTLIGGIPSWGSNGLYSLNGITSGTHSLTTGSSGTDFNISSVGSTHTFNIPDASTTARGLVTTGTQTFVGSKTFSGTLSTANLKVTGTTPTVGYVLTASATDGTATWAAPTSGLTGVGTMTTTSYANGATVSGSSLILAAADGTNGGVVTTGTQTFAGAKTFNSDIKVSSSPNSMTIGNGNGSQPRNIAIGYQTLNINTTGGNNTALGFTNMISNLTGANNTSVGAEALKNNLNNNNTAVGLFALRANNDGNDNTAMGYIAGWNNTSGTYNTSIGSNAMASNTTGSYNTAVGVSALSNTTGSNNTALGYNANVAVGTTITNATAIGNGASVSVSNTIQLGNTSVTDVKTSGKITAASFVVSGGNSSQVLMADGTFGTMPSVPATHYVGESYGGGIVFYVYEGGYHGLIAATSNQSTGIYWGASNLIRTSADGIGGGLKNSEVMAAYNNQTADNAASKCLGFNISGSDGVVYSDWYLPSRSELLFLYNQRTLSGLNMTTDAWYWSSTEYDYQQAYTVRFTTGYNHSYTAKNNGGVYVRAIRRF